MILLKYSEKEIEAVKKQYLKLIELNTQLSNLESIVTCNNVYLLIILETMRF